MKNNYNLKNVNNMTTEDLIKDIKRLHKNSNARIKRINDKELFSPAIEKVGGKFSDKNLSEMTVNQLRNEFKKVYDFTYNQTTSTVKGAQKYKKEIENRVQGYSGLTKKEQTKYWENYKKYTEEHPEYVNSLGSSRIQQIALETFSQNKGYKKFTEVMTKKSQKEYESESNYYDEDEEIFG